ncbi:hypothetical protein BC827DRAFT_1174002 [Russula dissimulans]|nr:hypothetical protein BC827DRAFT_1174002 [Russula dissimulans]
MTIRAWNSTEPPSPPTPMVITAHTTRATLTPSSLPSSTSDSAAAAHRHSGPFSNRALLRSIYNHLPLVPSLSTPKHVPMHLLSLLCALRTHFSRHRLLLSDFSSLLDAIPGVSAPVVQAHVHGAAIACSTLFVRPGLSDIFLTHPRCLPTYTNTCLHSHTRRRPVSRRTVAAGDQRVTIVRRHGLLLVPTAEPENAR